MDGHVGHAEGGALRVFGGADVTLNEVHFIGNTAFGRNGSALGSDGWDARGGAVFVDEGNLTVINSSFVDNLAMGGDATGLGGNRGGGGSGGAIYFNTDEVGGTLTIEQTSFEDNLAEGGRSAPGVLGRSGIGGAIRVLGNTGLGGPLTDVSSVGITLLSWKQQTAMLIEAVNTLSSDGVLNNGQTNGLLSKLKLKDNSGDADRIRGFLDNVAGHVSDETLTEEQAEPLLSASRILLASIANSDR